MKSCHNGSMTEPGGSARLSFLWRFSKIDEKFSKRKLWLILLQTASAFSYSDLNVGSSGLKMSSSNSGRYQNVTVKNKGVLNLNGWGLEVYGDMKVEKGSKVKNGVIIFRSKKGSLEGLPLYENVQERYGEIGGGLAAIWKNWEISDLPPMLVYDEAVAGYCFPVTAKGGSLYGADCDTIPSKDSPNYEMYQEESLFARTIQCFNYANNNPHPTAAMISAMTGMMTVAIKISL